jgi:hypothetical protein
VRDDVETGDQCDGQPDPAQRAQAGQRSPRFWPADGLVAGALVEADGGETPVGAGVPDDDLAAPQPPYSLRMLLRSPGGFSNERPDVDFRSLPLLPAMLSVFPRPLGQMDVSIGPGRVHGTGYGPPSGHRKR